VRAGLRRARALSMRRSIEWLVTLLAAASVVVVVAHWGWRWFGPDAVDLPRDPAQAVAPAVALSLSPPFGASSDAPVAATAVASPAGDVRLLGVIAERNGGGQALLRFADGSARLVVAGTRLSDAATLVAVRPDGVTVRDSGGERTIPLRVATAPAAGPRSTAPARSGACAIPRDFRGAVVRLNAELLQGLIGDPQALRAVVDAQDGALVVRDETGFATMLGLRKGDRVSQANGIALRAPEDVVVSILRPLAANQMVRVQGHRGAEPRELLIVNASACPA
jgi:type II secretory pathway component PulC